MNVALYGRGKRWALTERGASSVQRGAEWLAIGPSRLEWDGAGLTVTIAELSAPLPRRIRGTVRLHPAALETRVHTLDEAGRHRWSPIAPCARVEVALQSPDLSWSGPAYCDSNWGERPLEADFRQWDWARAPVQGGTIVHYNVDRRVQAAPLRLAMRYRAGGGVEDLEPPPVVVLARTAWRVGRGIGSEGSAQVVSTLEDTPFYARSVVGARWQGVEVPAMHESLSLDRFRALWVQAMLPFRMPRVF